MGANEEIHASSQLGLDDPAQWQRTSRSLQRIARSIVGEEALAEDLVQGAWLRSLQPGGRGKSLGWWHRWVRSRSIDLLRGRRHHPLDDPGSLPSVECAEAELVMRFELQRAVLRAVEELAEPYRTTIFLRYFKDLGPTEIAQRQGVPLKTVKSQITRGHARLRDTLSSRVNGEDGSTWSPAFLALAHASPATPNAVQLTPVPLASLASSSSLLFSTLMYKLAAGLISILLLVAAWQFTQPAPPAPAPQLANSVVASAYDQSSAASGDEEHQPNRERVLLSGSSANAEGLEAAIDPANGGALVLVRWETGEPAAGVHVLLSTTPRPRGFRRPTGADGIARFAELPCDLFELTTDRSGHQEFGSVEIQAGETTEVEIQLASGVQVRGRVVSRAGTPIPSASVWLTWGGPSWSAGAIVTQTDAGGRFVVRDVAPGSSLGALAAGHHPSALVDLDNVDTSEHQASIEIVLDAGGANLKGMVVNSAGSPLGDALVALGPLGRFNDSRADGSRVEAWTPRTMLTGVDGRFAFEGLRPGTTEVRVRRIGWAQWSTTLQLTRDGNHEQLVKLDRGAVVTGTVTDALGAPVPDATIHAFDIPLKETFLQNGQVNSPSFLDHELTRTDALGHYRLEHVSTGAMHLYALAPWPSDHVRGKPLHFARTLLRLSPDAPAQWNPKLVDGRVIEGSVHYRDGTPLTQVYVSVVDTDPDKRDYRSLRTSDGEFRFIQLPGEEYNVRVQIRDRPEGFEEPGVTGVRPGEAPIEVVAGWDAPAESAPCTVRVQFEDIHGRVNDPSRLSLWLEWGDQSRWTSGSRDGDHWTFSIDRPGNYRPVASLADRLIAVGALFECRPGVELELDPLVTGPGSTLVLDLQPSEAHPPTGLRAFLRHSNVRNAEPLNISQGSSLRIDNLEPGSGTLSVLGDNIRQQLLPFELKEGEETRLKVPLIPAAPVRYSIAWKRQEAPGTMAIRFRNRADGSLADQFDIPDAAEYTSPIDWSAFLPIGQFTFEVTLGNGREHREDFEVTSLDPHLAPKLNANLR